MLRLRHLSALGVLELTGRDHVRFLQGMLTCDVARLQARQGTHAAMINVKGRLLADLRLYRGATRCVLELEPALTDKVLGTLERHLIADDVTIADQSAAQAALMVYGPAGDVQGRVAALLPGVPSDPLAPYQFVEVQGLRVAADPELQLPALRICGMRAAIAALGDALAGAGASPLDDDTYEVLRVEAGRPRYGIDMSEDRMPPEARLDDAVSYSKGCYVGQEVLVRLRDQGHLNWKLMGLRLSGETAVPAKTRLSAPGRPDAGEITSCVCSPRLGPIALAYVHRSQQTHGTVLDVHDSAGQRTGTVVDLPFG